MARRAQKVPDPGPDLVGLPEILDYSDYRRYLADYYRIRKLMEPGFSLRSFARSADFPSHGLLKFLMEGKRNLSKRTVAKLSAALGLRKERSRYFEDLVFFNQASTLKEKDLYYRKLLKGAGAGPFRPLEGGRLRIFESWRAVAIREMLNLKGAKDDAAWLADRLLPRTDAREAREALARLQDAGLIAGADGGRRPLRPDIGTHDDLESFLVMGYHRQVLDLAAWAQDTLPPAERDISSACFTIRERDLPLLKERIARMRKELRDFSAPPGEGERVVQVAIQMFPLSKGG